MYTYTQADLDRFWVKVNKNGPVVREELGACWLWTAFKVKGYGKFRLYTDNRTPIQASRFSLFLAIGSFDGICRHKCDNPPCVNPDHLEPGTYKDNSLDCLKRERFKNQLTIEQVIQLRREAPEYTVRELSKKYEITEGNIRNAVSGTTYGWIDEPPTHCKRDVQLTDDQVYQIKLALQNPVWGISGRLAKKYGVSYWAIASIRSGKAYAHVSI